MGITRMMIEHLLAQLLPKRRHRHPFPFLCAIFVHSLLALLLQTNPIGAELEKLTTRTSFCRAISECRQRAQLELGQCAGGILPAMAAKKRMIQNEEESGEEKGRISGEEWTNGIGQKCILEMNKTIGNSMKALYERMERKALKCAEQSFVKPKKALNPNQLLSCKATHLDYLANISSPFALLSLRAQQFEDPSGPQECIQLYDAQLMRCETLNKCCPEMEICLRSIEEEAQIRRKEIRVLKLLDKCMNEIPVKSSEVIFMRRVAETAKSKEVASQQRDSQETNVEPIPVPILTTPTSSSTASPASTTPSPFFTSTTPTAGLLPMPDPTMRHLLDLIFPGLSINGNQGKHRKEDKIVSKERAKEKGAADRIVDFVLDKVNKAQQRNFGELVDQVVAKRKESSEAAVGIEGDPGKAKGMERIYTPSDGKKLDENVQAFSVSVGGEFTSSTPSTSESFVVQSNSVENTEGDEEEEEDEEGEDGTQNKGGKEGKLAKSIDQHSSAQSDSKSSKENGQDILPSTIKEERITAGVTAAFQNAATSPINTFATQKDKVLAMAVGRIFCHQYAECIGVRAKLGINCNANNNNNNGGPSTTDLAKNDWFSYEQMGNCLEARPMELLANAFAQANFCSIEEEFGKACQKLRECCPSIV